MLGRKRLLARLVAWEPRLIRLRAAPGYGKTSLSRLIARHYDSHAICDCAELAGTIDFAGRVISALADEAQTGGDAIARTRLRLHATQADEAAWTRSLLELWKSRADRSLFILENADAIAGDESVCSLLCDMLAARPPERVVLISSRMELPLDIARYLAPQQLLTFGESELRLDRDEALALFEGSDIPERIVERILRLATGWPIALLLLARVAHYDAKIEELLERLEAIPISQLHEYLVNDVLSALTPEMMSTMIAAAAIPGASLDDICGATGIRAALPIVEGLLRLPGFMSCEAGIYAMHPLLLWLLRPRHQHDFADYILRAARANEVLGDYLRAAELYHYSGDRSAAAVALNQLAPSVLAEPSPRVIATLAKIPLPTLSAHANLWIMILPFRRETVEPERLYDESVALTCAAAEPELAARLTLRRALLAQELERFAEASAALEELRGQHSLQTAQEQRLALITAALVAARQGHFTQAERWVEEADAVAGGRHMRFEAERAQIAMAKARFQGDWLELIELCNERLNAAQRSGSTARIIAAARDAAWSAWYANDDARVAEMQQLLRDCGSATIDRTDRMRAVTQWHAAMISIDREQADHFFHQAIAHLDRFENTFPRIIARVCAGMLLRSQRPRLTEARALARTIQSPSLQASIELLIDSTEPTECGIFKPLAARAMRSPLLVSSDALELDIARGQIRHGNEIVHVSDRALELLAALALLPPGTSKERLAIAIWPGLEAKSALNSLKMCVSRTRSQLQKDVVVSDRSGYALSGHITVDIRDFERTLRAAHGAVTLTESLRRRVDEAVRVLSASTRAYAAQWSWFAPHMLHIEELHRELALILAQDNLDRGELERHASGLPA